MSTLQAYEDLQTKNETEQTHESIIFRVHIPDGFAREHIGAKVEHEFGRVRVHGERSLGNNRRVRFNAQYEVPEYCDINKIKGKFDGKTVTITIPTIPEKVPKQEPQQPTQQEVQETESNPPDVEKEATTPPQSETTNDDQAETVANDDVTKSTTETSTSPKDTQGPKTSTSTSTPSNYTEESKHQVGEEEISQNDTSTKVESEKVKQVEETSTSPKDTQEPETQKGQEGIPTEDTKVESENQVDREASLSTPPKDTQESMPQKGQEQETIPPKDTFTTNAKLQGEEKFEGETHENEEKKKAIGKEETEEHSNKETLESGKPHEKVVVNDSPTKEGKESKGLDTIKGDTGREINGEIGNDHDVDKKSDKKVIPESARTRIKEVAASASQAMTSLAKRFKNEEDKQRIIYMGAAVLVVALGVYATYKLRSRRP